MSLWQLWKDSIQNLEAVHYGPFRFVELCHCLAIAQLHYHAGARQSPWLQRLVGLTIQTVGGNFLNSLLLGQPPAFLYSNTTLPLILLSYAVTFYSPFHIVPRILAFPPVWIAMMWVDLVTSCIGMTLGGVHRTAAALHNTVHGHLPALIVTGILGATGGSTLGSAFNLASKDWKFQPPVSYQRPFPMMVVVIACSLFYSCHAACHLGIHAGQHSSQHFDSAHAHHHQHGHYPCFPALMGWSIWSLEDAKGAVYLAMSLGKLLDAILKMYFSQNSSQASGSGEKSSQEQQQGGGVVKSGGEKEEKKANLLSKQNGEAPNFHAGVKCR
eukprot:TRINITY_DN2818_c0_g1_i2.p1 TRINITY_DN2818_c0_g1~~TRINITY_DN2818_c0_g1_i2.p1  ORF type:complete len:327 (+),score=53.65 TRINITY_DN2818_c0_g1_i2:42-1022(+)